RLLFGPSLPAANLSDEENWQDILDDKEWEDLDSDEEEIPTVFTTRFRGQSVSKNAPSSVSFPAVSASQDLRPEPQFVCFSNITKAPLPSPAPASVPALQSPAPASVPAPRQWPCPVPAPRRRPCPASTSVPELQPSASVPELQPSASVPAVMPAVVPAPASVPAVVPAPASVPAVVPAPASVPAVVPAPASEDKTASGPAFPATGSGSSGVPDSASSFAVFGALFMILCPYLPDSCICTCPCSCVHTCLVPAPVPARVLPTPAWFRLLQPVPRLLSLTSVGSPGN
uniref:Uncharacterized protein n=1 Tax=Xenopus tropicalis TaxID=8364 RepID=A0A803KCR3_XENTR